MKSFLRIVGVVLLAMVPFNVSFAKLRKGPIGETLPIEALDFDSSGMVDQEDLLSLLERMDAFVGQEKYSVIHDLQTDGGIDSDDLLLFLYGWKGIAPRPDPISTEEFLERTGLNNLSGKTWRFKCLTGGFEDCIGERRTVTGGPLTEIDGRTVLPILWGPESDEPWSVLYLTMDGDLGFLRVEKAGNPDQLPGLPLPPQTFGISGMIPWTTSETVYPGTAVIGSGTASLAYGVEKGGDNDDENVFVEICESVLYILLYGHPAPDLPVLQQGTCVAAGDLNGDGLGDVVAGGDDGELRIYLANDLPHFYCFQRVGDASKDLGIAFSLALGDVNGDELIDIVAGKRQGPNRVYLNNGTEDPFAGVTGIEISEASKETTSVALADFDGDGFLDLVEGRFDASTRVYLNNGSDIPFDGFAGTDLTNGPLGTTSVAVGDLDGDGDLDVVEGNLDETNRLYLNNGTSQPFFLVGGFEFEGEARKTQDIEIGDVDADGDLDIVEAASDRPPRFYSNNGTATPFLGIIGSDLRGSVDAGTIALALGNFHSRTHHLELLAIRGNSDDHLLYSNFVWDVDTQSTVYQTLGWWDTFFLGRHGDYDVAASDRDNDGESEVAIAGLSYHRLDDDRILENEIVRVIYDSRGWDVCAIAVDTRNDPSGSRVKGSVQPRSGLVQVSGEGTLGEPGGLEAHAQWNLYFDQDGLRFIQLCWEYLGMKKCLSYGRIPDATDDGGGPLGCMVETTDIGGFDGQFATLPRDECYRASVADGDFWDTFRVLPATTTTDLYILVQNLQGTGLQINIYAGSPTGGNLVYTENFDSYFERTFNDVPAGVDYWIEILFLGTPVSYQLRALTLN